MKDALGHGSNSGAHSTGIQSIAVKGKMQRRHFEAIAAELRAQPDAGSDAHRQRVADMASQLSTTNPGFRRDFFMAAAIPGEGKYNNKSRGRNSGMTKATKVIKQMRGA